MDGSDVIRRRDDLVVADIDDDMVALDVDGGTCFGFNATATHIWSLIAEPVSVADLCSQLTQQFDVGKAACERDLIALLVDLEAMGLIKTGPRTLAA